MGGVFGVAIIISCLWCFFGTRNAPSQPPQKDAADERTDQDRPPDPFLMLMSSYFLQAVAIGVMMAGFVIM
jgi:Na+/melibiose symporter-like transporter